MRKVAADEYEFSSHSHGMDVPAQQYHHYYAYPSAMSTPPMPMAPSSTPSSFALPAMSCMMNNTQQQYTPRRSFPATLPALTQQFLPRQENKTAIAFLLNPDEVKTELATTPTQRPSFGEHMTMEPVKEAPAKKKRKARICKTEGCEKYVVDRGLCIRHGGGKRCSVEDCNCRAQNRGLCWKHGGYTRCTVEGCTKRAKSRGICWSHGGGTRCKHDACTKIAVSHGLCWAHGGGKRCLIEGCRKPAYERNGNLCAEHCTSPMPASR